MPLHAADLLAPVVAPLAADLGPLDRLAVDARGPRLGLMPGGLADLTPQGVHHVLPGAVVAPLGEVVVDGALGREVVRQHVPLAARTVDVEDGVEDLSHVHLPRPSGEIDGDERLDQGPLVVTEVGRVGLAHWCMLPDRR